jgi:hypothetical protein
MKTKNIRRFWLLFNGMPHADKDAEKEALVLSFTDGRTASIHEMSLAEFQMMLASLEGMADASRHAPYDAALDKARKRVMAAIGNYLRRRNYAENAQKIFAIALHACEHQYKRFNDIPLQKLNALYAAFANQNRIAAIVDSMDKVVQRKRLIALYQEAMDGEEYEQAAEYRRELEMCS